MAHNESYEEFVDKFKPKLTTDDCYTPPTVYEAVADWVASEYGADKEKFCRPFYPGGDYENYDYNGRIVVDNPPFSILSKIIDFYTEKNVKFFLFAPNLTLFSTKRDRTVAVLPLGANITYENGATIATSFVTNLESSDIAIRTAPTLFQAVKAANTLELKKIKKQLPKYSYPDNVLTAAKIYSYNKYGIDVVIKDSECRFIRSLASQREKKKAIFGGGFLVSENCANILRQAEREKAEREKAEREKAERWKLSEDEQRIIKSLG